MMISLADTILEIIIFFSQLFNMVKWLECSPRVQSTGRVIPMTQKMVLDASLLNTQHYKVRIKGKVKKSREMSSALSYTLV